MTLEQALAALAARWRTLALVPVLAATLAWGAATVQPRHYEARASVVVDLRQDPLAAVPPGGLTASVAMATQVDVARSDRVAQVALERLDPGMKQALHTAWAAGEADAARAGARLLAAWHEAIEVRPARDSSVISIGFSAPQPALAAALANAAAQAYIDVALQLRVDPARRFSDFFQDRSDAARQRLDQARERLRAFQSANGLLPTDGRMDIEAARLGELSSQLTTLQAQVHDSAGRQAQAGAGQADRLQEVLNHPLLAQLKAEIGRAEAQLQQLSTRLGDQHPQLQEARAQLDTLRRRLADETARVSGGVGVTERVQRQRESALRAALADQRSRVVAQTAVRDQARALQDEVEQAQRAVEAIEQRLQQSHLESRRTQGNISLLSPALPPLEPTALAPALQGLLGALLGLLAAGSLALLQELRDRRLRRGDELELDLGLPLLAVVPSSDRDAPGLLRLLPVAARGRLRAASHNPGA